MTGLEVLGRELALPNEWRLGGGGRALWIPANPQSLDLPGFRDQGRFDRHILQPVFAVNLLDDRGSPIPLRACDRNWNPARLELRYKTRDVHLTERRTVTSSDAFVSQWTVVHAADVVRRFWLVAWTRLAALPDLRFCDLEANSRGISVQRLSTDHSAGKLGFALGASAFAESWSIECAGAQTALDWATTPFHEQMGPRGLPGRQPRRVDQAGGLYIALAYPLEIRPGEREIVSIVGAVADDVEAARGTLDVVAASIHPIHASEEEWINWFEEAPAFSCSNPSYQRLYWARWADRRLWRSWRADRVDGDLGFLGADFGAESAAVVENAWRLNNDEAVDAFADWLERPLDRALNQPIALAARRLLSLHPDADLLTELERVAEQLRDDGLAGAAESSLDDAQRIFAVDLLRLAAWIVDKEGGDASAFLTQATAHMPDAEGESPPRSPLAILPALVGGLPEPRLARLLECLADPDQFWTAHPLASLGRGQAGFRADAAESIDENCRGRVWPALNALVVEALGQAIEKAPALRRLFLAQLIDRTLGLAAAPGSSVEFHDHYNPHNGRPAATSDRQRPAGGWPIDHILRYIAGVRPREDGRIVFDPLPFGLEWFAVERLYVGDREFAIEWDQRSGLSVRVDEQPAAHAPVGRPLAIHLAEHWPGEESVEAAGYFQ